MTGKQSFDQWLYAHWPSKPEITHSDDSLTNDGSHVDCDDLTFFVLIPEQLTPDEINTTSIHVASCKHCQSIIAHLSANKERFEADLASERKYDPCNCHPVCGCG